MPTSHSWPRAAGVGCVVGLIAALPVALAFAAQTAASASADDGGQSQPHEAISEPAREVSVTIAGTLPNNVKAVLHAAAAELATGRIAADDDSILIRGIATPESRWQQSIATLRSVAPAGLAVRADIIEIDNKKPHSLLCRELFAVSTREPIRFQLAGDTIRTASYSALDRIAEFAFDCPTATIAITGHSDALGDPAFNLDLSRRRAQSVADYLVQQGVATERLQVVGAGASEPVADNDTSYGRRQNRRIEFEVSLRSESTN